MGAEWDLGIGPVGFCVRPLWQMGDMKKFFLGGMVDHVGSSWEVGVSGAFCYGVWGLGDSSALDSESKSGGVGGLRCGDGGYLLFRSHCGQT